MLAAIIWQDGPGLRAETGASRLRVVAPASKDGKWLEIDLSRQMLTAYRGVRAVRSMPISSGVPGWQTPTGTFWIYRKVADDRMRGYDPRRQAHWDVAHVPWAQYLRGGIAIHGAWWNRNFGTPRSHGCIQVATQTFNPHPQGVPEDAGWLYRFTTVGTPVRIVGTTPKARALQPLAYPRPSHVSPSGARSDASSIRSRPKSEG